MSFSLIDTHKLIVHVTTLFFFCFNQEEMNLKISFVLFLKYIFF